MCFLFGIKCGCKNYEAVWKSDVDGYCKILPAVVFTTNLFTIMNNINLTN